jgi:nucleotide-binding universal stress UspA family protein
MSALQRILVPVDGSPPSLAALDHAIALADDGDVIVDVLHVDVGDDVVEPTPAPDILQQFDRAMNDALRLADKRLGRRLSRLTRAGDPLREIITVATEGSYDLIVVGTHGRIGRLHEMLGSVAEGVVRNAPCPVLTVREPGSAYQSFADRRHHRPSLGEQSHPT